MLGSHEERDRRSGVQHRIGERQPRVRRRQSRLGDVRDRRGLVERRVAGEERGGVPVGPDAEQDQVERPAARASAERSGWICSSGTATRSSSASRAMRSFESGWSGGTTRSSLHQTCQSAQSRSRVGQLARRRARGVEPPASATRNGAVAPRDRRSSPRRTAARSRLARSSVPPPRRSGRARRCRAAPRAGRSASSRLRVVGRDLVAVDRDRRGRRPRARARA